MNVNPLQLQALQDMLQRSQIEVAFLQTKRFGSPAEALAFWELYAILSTLQAAVSEYVGAVCTAAEAQEVPR